jgi:hypothetical protein
MWLCIELGEGVAGWYRNPYPTTQAGSWLCHFARLWVRLRADEPPTKKRPYIDPAILEMKSRGEKWEINELEVQFEWTLIFLVRPMALSLFASADARSLGQPKDARRNP